MPKNYAKKVVANKNEYTRDRKTYFSGHRVRRFDITMGTIYFMVPRICNGGYVPFFVTAKKRRDTDQYYTKSLYQCVSTRKIERLAKEMGIEGIFTSQVSHINKGLDEQVEACRIRPLQSEYPFIYVDTFQ